MPARLQTIRATHSTLSQSVPVMSAAPYRYRGIPGWDPAAPAAGLGAGSRADLSNRNRSARARRRERFTALREEGTSVTAAGRAVGIAERTAREYESVRLRELL